VLNHNVETVPRLYRKVRSGGKYERTLELLDRSRRYRPAIATKTGVMVGMGEAHDELLALFDDLRAAGVSILTIGSTCGLIEAREDGPLLPSRRVCRAQRRSARARLRPRRVGPLVRSSYHAHEQADAFERQTR
jgi:lipoic acid synthetase